MKTAVITSPVELTAAELNNINTALKLEASDQIIQKVDPSVIAGLLIEVDGTAIDQTVKRQLTEIAQDK